ncbi:ABC transporter permease [Micromonospora sp. NPDC049044]|uniref:ABC transporter permease n=1 Tax=unclassified Micromonospora TaxID=2617518 RepID=UPI0033F225EA
MSVLALTRRGMADLRTSPAGVIPDLIAPTFLFLAALGIFGRLADLNNFSTNDFTSFVVPFGMVQAAGLVGSGAGVNFGQDIRTGLFDRLLLMPVRRAALLISAGIAATVRAAIAVVFLLLLGLALGARPTGPGNLLLSVGLAVAFGAVAAGWGLFVALRTGTSAAAPIMQAPIILLLVLGPAYAPRELLAGWLQPIAAVNPVSRLLEAARAPFLHGATWSSTWPGLVSVAAMLLVLYAAAAWLLSRHNR